MICVKVCQCRHMITQIDLLGCYWKFLCVNSLTQSGDLGEGIVRIPS